MQKLTTRVFTGFATVASAAALSIVGPTAPAHASATGFDVSRGADVVTYAGCRNFAATYSVPASIHASYDWVMEVVTYDASGHAVDNTSVTSVDGVPASGTVPLLICSTGEVGTYRVESKLDYYNNFGFHFYDQDSDTFVVRRPASRTALAVNDTSAAYGQRLHFTVKSAKERPSGFVANAGSTVRLEKYAGGAWRAIGSRTTDRYGKARFDVTWKHRGAVKVRAVTTATDGYGRSVSVTRTIS